MVSVPNLRCCPRQVQSGAKRGVHPWEWTGSGRCSDRLLSVFTLELHGAEMAKV